MYPTIACLIGDDATHELSHATKGEYQLVAARTPADLARLGASVELVVYDPSIHGDRHEAFTTWPESTPARVLCRMPIEAVGNAWLVKLAARRPTLEIYLGVDASCTANTWIGRIDGVAANGTLAMIGAAAGMQLSAAAMVYVCATILRGERKCSVHRLASTFTHDSERWAQMEAATLKLPAPHWLLGAALCMHTLARLEAGFELKAAAVLAGFRRSEPLVRRVSRISGRSPTEWMNSGGLGSALAWYDAGLREHRTSVTPLHLT